MSIDAKRIALRCCSVRVSIHFSFSEKTLMSPEKITDLIQHDPRRFRLRPDHVLEAKVASDGSPDAMDLTKKGIA